MASEEFQSKVCCVCAQSFKLTRRKFECMHCRGWVCKQDSVKQVGEKRRMCIKCEKKLAEQRIRVDFTHKLEELDERIEKTTKTNERLYREQMAQTATLNSVENQLADIRAHHLAQENALKAQIAAEETKAQQLKAAIENAKMKIEQASQYENELHQEHQELNATVRDLHTQNAELRKQKETMEAKHIRMQKSLKLSLAKEEINKKLCQKCKVRAYEAYETKKTQNEDESLHEMRRSSIIDSVSELRASVFESEPEKGECLLL